EPGGEPVAEKIVGEVGAPEGRVSDAGFGEGAVEIEHADEAGPGAGPVGDGEDGAAVGDEARQEVVGILPDAFGNDERRVRVDVGEDRHALLLRADETVFLFWFVRVGANEAGAVRG